MFNYREIKKEDRKRLTSQTAPNSDTESSKSAFSKAISCSFYKLRLTCMRTFQINIFPAYKNSTQLNLTFRNNDVNISTVLSFSSNSINNSFLLLSIK